MFRDFFGEWAKAFQKRRWYWWVILLLLYKVLENWILGLVQSLVQSMSVVAFKGLTDTLSKYPWLFTWIPIVITIIVLLILTWLDSRKVLKTSRGLKPILEMTKNASNQTPSERDYPQTYANWMASAINLDENHLESFILIYNVGIKWEHLLNTDSYFEPYFEIYSGSLFKLDIGKRIDGHLLYEKEEFERLIEVRSPIIQLERGYRRDKCKIQLRQWVSLSMMQRVAEDAGKEVTLNFGNINIWVDSKYPDGKDGPKCRLPIQNEYKVRIPMRDELENQHGS